MDSCALSGQTGRGRQPKLLAAMRAAAQPASNNFQTHTAIEFNHGMDKAPQAVADCNALSHHVITAVKCWESPVTIDWIMCCV